ncbi:MAG: SoxR reducing system RseC family protein [Desulfobacterales bacterium]|nr:SoxR reducing system RseC family protein [Desulfobacterales bacterium]
MATEEGIVVNTENSIAWVKTVRSTACDACSSKDACHMTGGGKEMEVKVLNIVKANSGDKVLIEFETASFLKVIFLIYLFPTLCLITGAVIGQILESKYNIGNASIMLGCLFLLISILYVIIRGKILSKKTEYTPKLIKIIKKAK